jgi:hypothetical protein
MIADPAADNLKQQIGIGEGREYEAQLRIGEVKLLLNLACRGTDIHPVDIGDEIHRAQHRQHDMRSLESKPQIRPPRVL